MEKTDVLVAGGGIAGLTAAARLCADGHHVTIVDPAPEPAATNDLRTTAFLQPAIETLDRAGAWELMMTTGAELQCMRIIDAGGKERVIRETADFAPDAVGHQAFGTNIPNHAARKALIECLSNASNARFVSGTSVVGYVSRLDCAIARLSSGAQINAKLIVAADGRNSTLRELANIPVRRWEYGQSALVFAVTHTRPHEGFSTEIHRTGGPLTLVPMPDHLGRPCSSVVWMMPSLKASDRNLLDDDDLAIEITAETMDLFGPFEIATPRAMWPIVGQVAMKLTSRRLAVIAEAAHVMPPIGAQGLNTSLHDIEVLAELVAEASDPGNPATLETYQRRVLPRTLARISGIDILNRAAMAEAQPLRDLRRFGLSLIARTPPLRDMAIRVGLGI